MNSNRRSQSAGEGGYNLSQSKQDDISYEASVGDGYTTEVVTEPNAATTEQTQAENETAASASNGYDYGNYYDPSSYQNYYRDDDGNYYYYVDPQQFVSNNAPPDTDASVPPTSQNLVRSYEYASYGPPTYNWFVDIVVDTFFAKPFLVYLTVLLYCAAAFIAALGLNYSFAMLYRMFAPPIPNVNKNLQPFAYLAMFLYFSFVIVAALCALMDMIRNLWTLKRDDVVFWGLSHQFFSKRKPPYFVYIAIILVTVFLPLFWGIIEAAVKKQSLVYVAQRYANVAVLAATFLVTICYVWFYWRALVFKWSSIAHRAERDDFQLRRYAYRNHPEKMNKTHWYHSSTVLEEFGVDRETLRYNSVVFTVGAVPLFALYAAHTLSTFTGAPQVTWPAIASLAVICIYVLSWMTVLRRKSQWATYASFILIAVLLVLGVAGGAIGGNAATVGIVLVLFVAAQGMVSRKRKHSLTKRELQATLKLPYSEQVEEEMSKKPRVDTYLFCCRNLILNYMKCCDVAKRFGYRHPDVVEAERRRMIHRIALRTDQKALLVWWIIVMLAVAFVVALSNGIQYRFTTQIAASTNESVPGLAPSLPLCETVFNADGSAPLKVLDLAFLAALSYTFGANGDADFAVWFSSKPFLVRMFPVVLPYTLNFATDGTNISFSDYVDVSNNFHVITLNSNYRGLSIFRYLDDWGESIALQASAAISPLIGIWDEQNRAAFVRKARFLKNWLPPSTALDSVKSYIAALNSSGKVSGILIVGDQFNGGYAKKLSAELKLPFVAFNPPGTKYMNEFLENGMQLSAVRSLWSYVDSLEDAANTVYYPCSSTLSSNRCGRISTVVDYLLETCGDETGRLMKQV
ncbi:hypothetical protein LSCM1_03997 [Leishmania martiniquensis]|uniref:Uncharacterized protein n=1 Tax=Leishmania martiniquensis TaxID=1580590 RepID=A0A836GRF1_9TRYP|nr:hypothetical protein LSCM1_03997 [Leishmania martiniquensis]